MKKQTTWRYCGLGSFALEITEFMVERFAHRLRAVPFHRILSSGTRLMSPSGRWR
jgi:hypothetical protein